MNTIRYYRATCGSLYRVTTTPATRTRPASCLQARRSPHARVFSPEYPTHPAEVAHLVAIGSFVEVPTTPPYAASSASLKPTSGLSSPSWAG